MAIANQLFISAIGFGIAYNAAPGAVNTESLRRGLARGFRPALLVQLGALIGDAAWAALALSGSALFLRDRNIRLVLGLVGAFFLIRLAWRAVQEAWRGGLPTVHGDTNRGDFATGVVFSLANPFGLAFWTGIGAGMTGTAGGAAGEGFVALFGGFVLGALLWCLCIPVVIGWGRRWVRPGVFRAVNALCGLALGYFSLRLLWGTLRTLFDHTDDAEAWVGQRAGDVMRLGALGNTR